MPSVNATPSAPICPGSAALTVLLVEDDPAQRIRIRELLRSATGAVVREAGSLAEARALLAEAAADVVLCDHHLPDGLGVSLMHEVHGADPDGILMIMTATPTADVEEQALAAGAADLLDKAVLSGDGLGRAIRYALRRRDDARALRAERRRYRDLARSMPEAGVVTCDRELRILAVEGEVYRQADADGERLVGHRLAPVLDALGLPDHAALYERALAGERLDHVQHWADGRCFLVRFGPVRDEHGDGIAGAMSVALDITTQHRAEAQRAEAQRSLNEVRQRFEVAFESAAAGFAITSPDGRLLEVNATFAGMLGLRVDELEGRTIASITHPDDVNASLEYMREALAGRVEHGQFEKRFRHADGGSVQALLSAAVVRDEHGDPQYFSSQIVDLTERRRAEEALRASLQRQHLVLANLPGTVIALYDRDLRVAEVEGMDADNADGHTAESVRGAPMRDFFTAEAYASIEPLMHAALAGEHAATEHVAADGRTFTLHIAPFSEHERVTGVLTVWHDVTDRVEAAARHADQLNAIAHVARAVGHSDPVEARRTVCDTAIAVGDGMTTASIWEPLPDGSLQTTATLPATAAPRRIAADALEHGAHVVLATGEALFVADAATSPHCDAQIIAAIGAVSVLFLPIIDGATTRGVLAVGWPHRLDAVSEQQGLLMEVLADEAAVAMHRADLMSRLDELTRTDELTGLPNRRAWDDLLAHELAAARRHGQPLAVAMLDLDHFKHYNDRHGHLAGDRLLRHAAAAWQQRLRATDVLARWGGEEFALLLPGCTAADAALVVDDLRGALIDAVTFSAGIACSDGAVAAQELLDTADRALYRAKAGGRDRSVIDAGA